jgi:hypothetical protein
MKDDKFLKWLDEIEESQIPTLNGPVFSKRGETMKKLTAALRKSYEANQFYAAYEDEETMWDRRGVNKAREAIQELHEIAGVKE